MIPDREVHIDYDTSGAPTIQAFHEDDSFMRAILGPVGSAKSTGGSMETVFRANAQEPLIGSRYRPTKWAVVRNTYRSLEDTTIQTYQQWIPPAIGHWRASAHEFTAEWDHPSGDGTIVEMTVIFRALNTLADAGKLLSLEVTGGFFNEAREIPWGIIDLFQSRVGRFPPKKLCSVPAWNGIWMDTNPPDTDSQFYRMFEEVRPPGYKLFHQPSGLSDEAENKDNLIDGYYERLCHGKSDDFISVYVRSEYGFVNDGKAVFPEYVDQQHCRDEEFTPRQDEDIYIGIDFGLTPAAAFAQRTVTGKWVVFDELTTEEMGAVRFAAELNRKISRDYPDNTFQIYGDPAGEGRSQTDENTPYRILRAAGIDVQKPSTNDQTIRFEAIRATLTRMDMVAEPGFLILPKCKMLRKSLKGGYCYKRIMIAGGDRFQDKPDKHSPYSHVNDALQYLLLGAGEGKKVVATSSRSRRSLSRNHINRAVV